MAAVVWCQTPSGARSRSSSTPTGTSLKSAPSRQRTSPAPPCQARVAGLSQGRTRGRSTSVVARYPRPAPRLVPNLEQAAPTGNGEPAGPRRAPFAPGQRESERASRLSSPNRLDSQAFAFPGQRERREPVPQRTPRTGSQPAPNAEPFFSRRQPTARVGKQKPPRSDPRGLRRFSPELRALRALRVSRRCSRGCSQRAPSERDERRVGQLSRSLSCPVGREKRRGV